MGTTEATRTAIPAGTYRVDPLHSSVTFAVRHNGVSMFRSGFDRYDVRLSGGESPSLEGTVEVASVRIPDEQLKGHLLSAEFFDAQRHPRLSFSSRELQVAGDGALTLRGELEIRGERHEVTALGGFAELDADAYGNPRAGLSLEARVDRRAFGLDWNAELPSGGQVLDYEVTIAVELELVGESD
jgi:polyisoprenoid-binding protein YceI